MGENMNILRTHCIQQKFINTLIVWFILGINTTLANAQTTPVALVPTSQPVQTTASPQTPPSQPVQIALETKITPPSVPTEWNLKVVSVKPEKAAMGENITIKLDGLSHALEDKNFDPYKLILYFGNYALEGIYPEADSLKQKNEELTFKLKRKPENNKQWISLIGSPSAFELPVMVSVGFKDQKAYSTDPTSGHNFTFIVIRKGLFVGGIAIFILMIGLFVWLAKTSSIIRDSNPPLSHYNTIPYSLAKFQASFWFFLVAGSFLLIWLITGDYTNSLTEQSLVLIGIGTGTALGAAMIDSSKREASDKNLAILQPKVSKLDAEIKEFTSQIDLLETVIAASLGTVNQKDALSKLKIETVEKIAELTELKKQMDEARSGLSKPTSEGFVADLLTDANGINFHRFQMLVWTLVMAIIFCVEVFKTLRMPEFSTTLMSLMGISAGTYLGFKIPEKQIKTE